jgi:hypothetical protein
MLYYAKYFLLRATSVTRQEVLMDAALLKRPSAVIPVAMSAVALATVIGYAAMFGTARQADEGTAAHIWQVLMAGQLPVMAFVAIKWLPIEPRQTLLVLALHVGAALAAMFPVWWFQW